MNNNAPTLHPSTEITTSFLSAGCANDENLYNSLKADPIGTILSLTSIDFSSINITIVENTKSECALALPYYSHLEELNAFSVQDRDLSDASGGEIIGTLGAFFGGLGFALGFGVASSTIATATTLYSGGAVAAGIAITVAIASISVPVVAGTIGGAAGIAVRAESDAWGK